MRISHGRLCRHHLLIVIEGLGSVDLFDQVLHLILPICIWHCQWREDRSLHSHCSGIESRLWDIKLLLVQAGRKISVECHYVRSYSHYNLLWLLYHIHLVGNWHRDKLWFSLKCLILRKLRDLIRCGWGNTTHWGWRVKAEQHLIKGILIIASVVTCFVTTIGIYQSETLFHTRAL